jgi:hypothetical protein
MYSTSNSIVFCILLYACNKNNFVLQYVPQINKYDSGLVTNPLTAKGTFLLATPKAVLRFLPKTILPRSTGVFIIFSMTPKRFEIKTTKRKKVEENSGFIRVRHILRTRTFDIDRHQRH